MNDLTQEILAKRIGKSRQFIIDQEISCTKIDTLQLISIALNCGVSELMPKNNYEIELSKFDREKIENATSPKLSIQVGRRIMLMRIINGYSQYQLAARTDKEGISQKSISILETNGCKKISTMYAIAQALQCPIGVFIE